MCYLAAVKPVLKDQIKRPTGKRLAAIRGAVLSRGSSFQLGVLLGVAPVDDGPPRSAEVAHSAHRPRKFGGTIGALIDRFTPNECANYFENAGYAST